MPLASLPLVDALLVLATAAGVDVDRERADEAVVQVLTLDADPSAALVRAALAVGLSARIVELSAGDLARGREGRLLPAVAFTDGGVPVVATRRRLGRVEIADLADGGTRRAVAGRALAAALGRDGGAPIPWVVADPQRGLDALAHRAGDATIKASPVRRLVALARIEKDDVAVSVVFALGVGLLSVAMPVGVQVLVNTVAFGALLQPLVVLTVLVAAGLSSAGALHALQFWIVERLQQRLFARVALDLAHRLPRVHLDALDGRHGPELVNRFFEVTTLQKGAATLLVEGVSVGLQTAVGLVLLAFYHPLLLGFDVFLVLSLAFVFLVLGRGAAHTAVKESTAKYALAAWLQETVRHVHAFRLQGGDAFARTRAESLTRSYVTARRKHFAVVFRQYGAALVLQAIASAVLLGVGGALVMSQKLTLGQLVAAELIVTAVVTSFSKLGKYLETTYDVLAGIDKLGAVVDLPVEGHGGIDLPVRAEGVRLRAEHVAVEHGGRRLLAPTSLELHPGARLAVLGPNGAGKSLLVDVLAGLRTPASGRLDVDGVDVRELEPSSFRRQVAVVREADVYAGSLAENLRHGRPEVTRHDLRRTLEALGAWEHVTALPSGLDTMVATRAAGLPSGLVTLLVLARALAGRPRLLVVDGALDALDLRTRERVLDAITTLLPRTSVVITTSETALVATCDEVLRLDRPPPRMPLEAAARPT